MKAVSCVICAHNEGDRKGGVLDALNNHPLIREVIVVDDGSTDRTAEVVSSYSKVRLVTHEANKGKSAALATGVSHAENDTLLLLDADLEGLTPDALHGLL